MAAIRFGIHDFLSTLGEERRPPLPQGRVTQRFLVEVGLDKAFLEWRKEQHRRLKQSKPRTEDVREKDRVDQAVSRARRSGASATRSEALIHVQVNRSSKPGPIPRVPRFVEVVVRDDLRSAAFEKLELTTFSKSEHQRKAVAQGESTTFGMVFSRRLQRYQESYTCRNNPRLYKLLQELAKAEIPEFSYTTIGVNKNVVTRRHTDKYNVGPTMILALGDFEGGDLVVRDKTFPLSEKKWLYFWGKDEHYNTQLCKGVKYTITYFTLLPPYAPPTAQTHAQLGRL